MPIPYEQMVDLIEHRDYLLAYTDEKEGVTYYTPNDEEWFDVVAVHHEQQLVEKTGFFETDDFEQPDSDYAYVVHNGELTPRYLTR